MKYDAISDVGKRASQNEDFYLLPNHDRGGIFNINRRKNGSLFILCDGMGGANAGEVASELTANRIFRDYYKSQSIFASTQKDLADVIIGANQKIHALAQEHSEYSGMGSTLVAVLFHRSIAHIFSVGDSRVYLYRQNELSQITEDQSEVWELYKQGEISKDALRAHPRKNIITMAIGANEGISIENINQYSVRITKNDLFLMCSDGLTDMVSDDAIVRVLATKKTLKEINKSLVDLANAEGGRDNITVILVQI